MTPKPKKREGRVLSREQFEKEYIGHFVEEPKHPLFYEWLEYYEKSENLDRMFDGHWSKHSVWIPFPNQRLNELRKSIRVPLSHGLDRKTCLMLRNEALKYHERLLKNGPPQRKEDEDE